MSIQASVAVRNAMLDAIETAIGPSAILQIFTGPAPGSCDAADTGTVLAEFDLSADWASPASAGEKDFTELPLATNGLTNGEAGHFRLFDETNTCHFQGSVTSTGDGGDMEVDNTNIVTGQTVKITTFGLSFSSMA